MFYTRELEQEFNPKRLGNWCIPRGLPARPKIRHGHTDVISNDKGHLLPGAHRPIILSQDQFLTTWELPKKITRQWCKERSVQRPLIRGTTYKRDGISTKPLIAPTKTKPPKKTKRPLTSYPDKKIEEKATCSRTKKHIHPCILAGPILDSDREPLQKEQIATSITTNIDLSKHGKTNNDKTTCDSSQKKVEDNIEVHPSSKENIMNGKSLTYVPGDLTSPRHRSESYYRLRPKTTSGTEVQQRLVEKGTSPKSIRPPSPFALAMKNFAQAKQCARENLEHQPLPDMLAHRAYRRMQMLRAREPGLALPDDIGGATGVAWKQKLAGPTHCTKMRIYRPKTTGHPDGFNNKAKIGRPLSCDGSFDQNWRFIKQKDVSPIELAICWDMRPEDPRDEPQRTKHIDGSNGSAAPAVFQIVHSPKENAPSPEKSPLWKDRLHTIKRRSASTDSLYVNVSNGRHLLGSTPDLRARTSIGAKRCTACTTKPLSAPIGPSARPQAEYKMAFKAGVPTGGGSTCSSGSKASINVPKQREPYAKRNYDINSLSPPFSMARSGSASGSCVQYPEHWRLATVYQHSYKNPAAQRHRLLQNVFQ